MSRKRSIAYLRRSAGKGRPYAQFKLGCRLRFDIFRHAHLAGDKAQLEALLKADQEEGKSQLLAAWKNGQKTAGRELALSQLLSPDFSAKSAAQILFDYAASGRDVEAAVALWHMYAQHFDEPALRRLFSLYVRRSTTLSEVLQCKLNNA